ncbi:MAG TPA: hypothetical protein VHV76_12385 [Mycobacteriales bacterium]|nr:hypothetical protein [Mycobacteriales bacterium]
MSEDYVRPPIVALELPSQRASIWRFRATMTVLLLLLVVIIVWIAHAIVHNSEGSPDVGSGLARWHVAVSAVSFNAASLNVAR